MGSKEMGLAVLEAIAAAGDDVELAGVIAYNDEDDPRSRLPEFERAAESAGVAFATASSAAQVTEAVSSLTRDAVIVCGWYRSIPVEELEPRFFGFHSSPLPRYRGGAPLVWQIIEGEPEIAISMFELVPGLDEGGIVAQASRPFGERETISDALAWATVAAVELTERHVAEVADGSVRLTPQDHSQASYCSQRLPVDGRIDWTQPARAIHDFVRAQTSPYPGAFARTEDGETVRIWRTEPDERPYLGPPGAVVERNGDGVVVTCGEGAIRVLEAGRNGSDPEPAVALFPDLSVRLS